MFSERVKNISPSLTLAISAQAKAMRKQGLDVVSLSAGEPDFDTPENIKEKAKQALDKGFTKYTPSSGLVELKEAIIRKFKEDNGLDYNLNQILVSPGAKYVIFEVIFSLVKPGEEVIIPSPYWVSYPEMVRLAAGTPVFLETKEEDNFKINPQQLEKLITPKTKLLILNSPSNPAGIVYNRQELEKIGKVIEERGIFCLSDEIYEKIIFDNLTHISIASLSSKLKERTIVVNGLSKAYAMTGWRIGYGGGPEEIIRLVSTLQSHTTSCPASISQHAGIEALEGSQEEVRKMRAEFEKRRDYLLQRISKIRGLSCIKPQGAFYCFLDISNFLGRKIKDKIVKGSLEFASVLLEEEKVAVIPGKAFGRDDFVRISFATSLEELKKGLDRIENFLNKLT
ncbi:MAG TPA: pyridoxal phosphate-dependent aminotransferase [Candidatus Omnitrophica bacterium]|nr:pyridoxal phosphate-dependent aminotransferase [Candidatus Omnitrophota bacterium]